MTSDDPSTDKKTLILDAATRLLTTSGLQALSFEMLAKQTGLSRQLIRYYYPNLDGLVAELCDYLGKVYQDVLIAGVVKVGQVERLDFFLDFFFGVSADYPMPDNLEAYDSLFAYCVGAPDVKTRLRAKYRTLGQVIQHELAIAYPQLDAPACDELAFLFVSLMHAHWSYIATLGFSQDYNRVARKAIDRLITSYCDGVPTTPIIEKSWMRDP